MDLISPFWFAQRQGKAEPVASDTFRLTAPNLKPAFISIRAGPSGQWLATLQLELDGPELAATPDQFEKREDAWDAAFELYRTHIVV
jgi:hypothetical protein